MSQSGFAQKDLETVLKLIRQISQMPEVEALAALDGLLKQIGLAATPVVHVSTTEDSWRQRQFEDAEARLNKEVDKLRAGIRDPAILAPWQPTTVRQQADQLDQWLGSDLTGRYALRVAELRATVGKLASEAEYALVRRSADEALTRPIHSTASARSILAAVDENRQMQQPATAARRLSRTLICWRGRRPQLICRSLGGPTSALPSLSPAATSRPSSRPSPGSHSRRRSVTYA